MAKAMVSINLKNAQELEYFSVLGVMLQAYSFKLMLIKDLLVRRLFDLDPRPRSRPLSMY
jgi:hypothetical protein